MMNEILPPFTISSHPNSLQSTSASQSHSSRFDHLSTKPVIRFRRSIKKKLNSTESAQVITTVPGEGWSIHNVSNQTILSSQKLSPNLILSAPCVSVSLPKQDSSNPSTEPFSSNTQIKSRLRYVYAPIASSPAHPSGPVNEGRTVWVWIETEVRGGYGERIRSNSSDQKETDGSANLMKEFDSRVKMIQVLPQTHHHPIQKQSDSKSMTIVRVMVLLESGDLLLCDQDLSIIMTYRSSSSIKSSTNPTSSNDLLRMQAVMDSIEEDHPSTALSSILGSHHKRPESLVLYITRAKSVMRQTTVEETPLSSPATNGRSKKRKSGLIAKSVPTKSIPQVSYYSNLEIEMYEIALDSVQMIGHLSSQQDFFDVAIGANGWVTILGYDQILRSSRLTPDSQNDRLLSVKSLSLEPHVKFPPLDLSPCFAGLGPVSRITPLPTLQPQYAITPMVILFMSHSTTIEDPVSSCHCLMIDHYHRAVLYSHLSPWPASQTQESSSSSSHETAYPLRISSESASIHHPSYVYLTQSGNGRRLVQAFQLPKSFASGPTWVDVLNPSVVKSTTTWIKSQHSSSLTTSPSTILDDQKRIPDLLIAAISTFESELPPSEVRDRQLIEFSTLVQRLNEAWNKTPDSNGAWDKTTANAAEVAWVEWVHQHSKLTAQTVIGTEPMERSENGITQPTATRSEGGKSVKKSTLVNQPIQFTLPKSVVEIVLRMCLNRFLNLSRIESTEERRDEEAERILKMNKVKYPSKIITSLLNMSLVEDEMIPGGFFLTIRRTKDWFNIGLSISKLLDLHEEHLIETVQEVIQYDLKLIERHQSDDQFSSPNHLKPLLANIISQPLSSVGLRKALKSKLSTEEVLIVLEVMKEWMRWWIPIEKIEEEEEEEEEGEEGEGVEKIEKEERRKLSLSEKKVKKGRVKIKKMDGVIVPELEYIINFVICCLDSHLIGLIQFERCEESLKLIRGLVSQERRSIESLERLNPSIVHFSQTVLSTRVSKDKKNQKEWNMEKKKKEKEKEKKKAQKKKDGKSFGMSKKKREEMWEANLAVGEYSIETFVF